MPVRREQGADLTPFGEFARDVEMLLRASRNPRAVFATLSMLVQEGTDAALVGRAVREMIANGEDFNAARFRGFLRSLKAPREQAVAGVIAPTDALVDLDKALAWSRQFGGFRYAPGDRYLADIPEPIRKALGRCGGIIAFERADEIGLRMLRKQFVTEWSREASHAPA